MRTTGLIGKAEEIIQVSESPMMNGNGNSMATFKLYEAQVIPALLFNSESWIGITDTHISDLQNFQDKFVKKLLRLPPSTPKAILHWDSGMTLMKWRIAEKKLLFFRKIMLKEERNITRKVLLKEMFMGLKGLRHECRELTEIMGIPDIMTNLVSIGEIKQAVVNFSKQVMTDEIKSSAKVETGSRRIHWTTPT